MTEKEMLFEMMKTIAPVLVKKGIELQESLVDSGANPEKCKIDGKTIPEAYAESARIWAEAFTKEIYNR